MIPTLGSRPFQRPEERASYRRCRAVVTDGGRVGNPKEGHGYLSALRSGGAEKKWFRPVAPLPGSTYNGGLPCETCGATEVVG